MSQNEDQRLQQAREELLAKCAAARQRLEEIRKNCAKLKEQFKPVVKPPKARWYRLLFGIRVK